MTGRTSSFTKLTMTTLYQGDFIYIYIYIYSFPLAFAFMCVVCVCIYMSVYVCVCVFFFAGRWMLNHAFLEGSRSTVTTQIYYIAHSLTSFVSFVFLYLSF